MTVSIVEQSDFMREEPYYLKYPREYCWLTNRTLYTRTFQYLLEQFALL